MRYPNVVGPVAALALAIAGPAGCTDESVGSRFCGNGVVDPGEACDDGANNSDETPDACRSDCTAPACGDGVIDFNEACEAGDLGGATCEDLGFAGGELGCRDCTLDTMGCLSPECGNNARCEPGEEVTCPGCAAVEVAAAGTQTCALRADGSMWCWGLNDFGQLGVGTGNDIMESQPRAVLNLAGAAGIASGGGMVLLNAACAIEADGGVACWGAINGATSPAAVPALADVVSVSVADIHGCAADIDGVAWCWGDNEFGQLGDGTTGTAHQTPTRVTGLADVVAVTCGTSGSPDHVGPVSGGHSCALLSDGSAWCWGSGGNGQLGDGASASSAVPVAVTGLGPAAVLSAGGESVGGDKGHTCAALRDGTAACWGAGWAGQLGDGDTTASAVPVTVTGLHDVVAVSAGGIHSCALHGTGTVSCWGHNFHGQIGDGTDINRPEPVAVTGLAHAVAIDAGAYHTCALLNDGSLRCWGNGDFGQLGHGQTTGSWAPVQPTRF